MCEETGHRKIQTNRLAKVSIVIYGETKCHTDLPIALKHLE